MKDEIKIEKTPNFDELKNEIFKWADNKNLIHIDNVNRQFMKVVEELGELSSAILKKDQENIVDGLGDVLVTVIILNYQLGYSPTYTLNEAYKTIKYRTGKTVDGVFVKDTDLKDS